MMKLPKELTVELLGLVLDKKVDAIRSEVDNILYFITIDEDELEYDEMLNLDTLTRLMKEWCRDSDYYLLSYISQLGGVCEVLTEFNEKVFDTCKLHCKTEFEAVLKATEWVAKEKGLL